MHVFIFLTFRISNQLIQLIFQSYVIDISSIYCPFLLPWKCVGSTPIKDDTMLVTNYLMMTSPTSLEPLNLAWRKILNLTEWQIVQIRYHGTVSAAGHDFEKNVRIKHGKPSLWWFGIHTGSKYHASRWLAVT